MILNPAIIALLMGSFLISLMMLYSGFWGLKILRKWDLRSGSEMQIALERRTYLISTILNYVFSFQLASLFLFIYTTEDIHRFFVGAMCAAGTLNVNEYGYPLLIMKTVSFLMAGLWLVLNYTDTRAYDYPLIKVKYGFLLVILPFILVEAYLETKYFLNLRADVITSCCGSLFSSANTGVASDMASLPPRSALAAYAVVLGIVLISGVTSLLTDRGGYVFSLLSFFLLIAAIIAIISAVSIYIYELPTHHCPFCILQKEYKYIGYLFYTTLFGGALSGMASGALQPFRKKKSLEDILPEIQKKLTIISLVFFVIFSLIVVLSIFSSHLKLS